MKLLPVAALLLLFFGCTQENQDSELKMPSKNSNISIRSPDFNNNGFIPREFTCDGSRLTPRITIENIPKNAKSLALIMDDPDAPMGTFVH